MKAMASNSASEHRLRSLNDIPPLIHDQGVLLGEDESRHSHYYNFFIFFSKKKEIIQRQ